VCPAFKLVLIQKRMFNTVLDISICSSSSSSSSSSSGSSSSSSSSSSVVVVVVVVAAAAVRTCSFRSPTPSILANV
jgi:hypothetical protein